MTIGMLGGSFCPPTTAHLELSKKCIENGLCDKVIWVPVNDAYKKATNIPSKHRVEMVKLTLQNEENIDFSLHELNFDTTVYTIDSIKMLQEKYPNDKIVFIAGADKMGFKWFQREEFVRDFGYIVTSRGDIDCNEMIEKSRNLSKYRDNIKILDFDSNISSTIVRDDIREKKNSEYVTPEVLQYILEHDLFV